MHITLYRKYRPKNFEEIAGQKEIVKTLKASLRNGKTSHAYLFTGPRGVGKTTIARLIAKGVNCLKNGITDEPCNECANCLSINEGNFMDMIEIDAASNRGIDEIRQLKEKINYQPVNGRKKIYIIDEVHMLTKEAFNALLKTLEEPPEHVIFILATTEADKILPTIISRCQRYDFKALSPNEMKEKLGDIAKAEGIEVPDDVLDLIYENSGGSMRDATSILERVMITCLDEKITLEKAEQVLGVTPVKKMQEFLEKLLEKNYTNLIKILDDFWRESVEIELF
ncbi:MAG: DNA polymerase III subunit gamma/tau, partial [Fusobacterium sp.]|nr:DNA polymerase III subunit gamma/tau [Fusobacterium sp.]